MQRDTSSDTAFDITSRLSAWRANMLQVLLSTIAIAATPVMTFVILEAVRNPVQWPAALGFLVIYLLIVGLAIFRRLDFRLRAWSLLLLIYVAGVLAFARGGLAGDGRVYLLALPVLALILTGLRSGLVMAILSLLTFVAFAVTAHLGWMAEWLVRQDNSLLLMDWVIGGVAFLLTLAALVAMQWQFSRFQEAIAVESLRLYEESERLRAFNENIVQNMEEGILLDDATGHIAFVNSKAAELLGYAPEELIGRRWRPFVAPEHVAKIEEEAAKWPQGIASRYETVLLTQDGQRVPVFISARPLFDGGRFTGVLSVLTDITERERADEALERRVAQLALINDIGGKIAAMRELDSVLNRAARLVQDNFGYHHVGLFTMDHERGDLVMKTRAGAFAHLFPSDHRLKSGQGMVGWVACHGEMLLANDVDAEPRYVNLYPDVIPTRSELSMPIRVGEEIVGVLDVQSPQIGAFDENDVMTIETVADQIAVAIENARLFEAVQQELTDRKRMDETLRRLVEFGDFITTIAIYFLNLPPDDVGSGINHALQAIGGLAGVDRGYLFLLSPDGMQIDDAYEWCAPGIAPHIGDRKSLPLEHPSWWMGKLKWFQTIHVPCIADLPPEARVEEETWLPPTIRSVIATPMVYGGSLVGFLSFSSERVEKTWGEVEINLLRTVAEILASALARKQAEKALWESEEMERAILNATTESVMLLDNQGVILALNQTAAQRFGKSVDELVGLYTGDLVQDSFSPAAVKSRMERIDGVIRSGKPIRFEDGRAGTFFDTNIYPIFDEQGKVARLAVFARDITARRRAEQQAVRSERLAAMGHLAATLAHEINNPLQAIRSNLELVLDFELEQDEHRECLNVIHQEIKRLSEITQRVLDFARPGGDTRYPTHITHLMHHTLTLLGKQLQHSHIQVTTDFPIDLPPAMVAPNRIVQVLLNLMLNAVEAMPDGGHVHITAHTDKGMIVLALTNDGPSLPAEHIEHIFDPFFTTKPNGTGMGLSISHSIIQQHGGTISVQNLKDGRGVTFIIALPPARPGKVQEAIA